MKFNIGDRVVHPQHGVGEVAKLEDREFGSSVTQRYYEVPIPSVGSTLWVPLENRLSTVCGNWQSIVKLIPAARYSHPSLCLLQMIRVHDRQPWQDASGKGGSICTM